MRCLVYNVCHQHTRAIYIASHVYVASWPLRVTNTLVSYHVSHMYGASWPRCIAKTLVLYYVYQVQTVPINSNQLQLIATDTPNTFNIASPPGSNEASSLIFFKHPHYLIRLICFELFVTIALPPLSRQGTEIIPYIKRFLEWIETHSLGGKLQSQNVLQVPSSFLKSTSGLDTTRLDSTPILYPKPHSVLEQSRIF
jgi:hypothetical protein